MRKIYISDYTLRALAEKRDSGVLFREKTAIAACLDSFGIDLVELPEVKNIKEDKIVYKTVSSFVKNCYLCLPVGISAEDVRNAAECIGDANKPCLQVALPVSTVQMEYRYHFKNDKMIDKISQLCSEAAKYCTLVEFVAEDATRADAGFLMDACKTAEESGAKFVTLCDDVGTALPSDIYKMVKGIKESCGLPVFVKVSDNINVSVAAAIAAVEAGADGIKTSCTGENVLKTESLADALSVCGERLGITTNMKTTEIHSDVSRMSKYFSHAEEMNTDSADGDSDIFLDSESGLPQVCEAVRKLGYDLSDEDNGNVYKALLSVCERKNSVGAKELEAIIASSAMQAPSTYHLDTFLVNSSNVSASMAQVTMKKDGETVSGVSTGDGPIDAAFRAIEQGIGYHYELDDFQIQAVTEGQEAIGSALVRLRFDGKLYSGNGLSTDIVGASIRAYINALNKIVYDEK